MSARLERPYERRDWRTQRLGVSKSRAAKEGVEAIYRRYRSLLKPNECTRLEDLDGALKAWEEHVRQSVAPTTYSSV